MGWNDFTNELLEKIGENTYELALNMHSPVTLGKQLKIAAILEKSNRANNNYRITANDIALVRIQHDFPADMRLTALNGNNTMTYNRNLILKEFFGVSPEHGNGLHDMEGWRKGMMRPYYRPSKHFTLNTLVKNFIDPTAGKMDFTSDNFIIIEPLSKHLHSPPKVLNPLDTFFDVEEKPFDISKKAVILVREQAKHLVETPEAKKALAGRKVIFFSGSPSLAVDIVLVNLGYLPQEYNPDTFILPTNKADEKRLFSPDDEKYTEDFKAAIEAICAKNEIQSYLKLPESILKIRRTCEERYGVKYATYGLLHDESDYRTKELFLNGKALADQDKKFVKFLLNSALENNMITSAECASLTLSATTAISETFSQSQGAYKYSNNILKNCDPAFADLIKRMGLNMISREARRFDEQEITLFNKRKKTKRTLPIVKRKSVTGKFTIIPTR